MAKSKKIKQNEGPLKDSEIVFHNLDNTDSIKVPLSNEQILELDKNEKNELPKDSE